MTNIKIIKSETITKTVAELCKQANLTITKDTYNALSRAYDIESSSSCKRVLGQILENAKLAFNKQRPLCQDTGLVVIFIEIGQNIHIEGELINNAINNGVNLAYKDNYFRKSIVKDAIFDRTNTEDNTPAVIYTELIKEDEIRINVAVKGGGSENMSAVKMLSPSDGKKGIIDFIVNTVRDAGAKPCPPIRVGVGIGGSFEYSALLSKKALLKPISETTELEQEILSAINNLGIGAAGLGGDITAYGVNVLTASSHIASLPVAVNINCHSSRHAGATIKEDEIIYNDELFKGEFLNVENDNSTLKTINLNDTESIRMLKAGDEVLLTGIVYSARDAAHKKIIELIESKQALPFKVENSTIYYVGPCPAKEGEIIGPAGPTTSSRMDKFAPVLYKEGIIATIGKGNRSDEVVKAIKDYKSIYFTTIGGTAVLTSEFIKKAECIAFEELGPEAIYRLEIENFPAIVAIDSNGNNIY